MLIDANAQKSKFKMATVRHFGIVALGPSTKFFIGPHQPVKFCANPMHSFEGMRFEFLADLA